MSAAPNLLVLFPDQFRRAALGVAGEDPVRTPHLDALATGGRVFPNAVSNLPLCSPARAMLWTGRYPFSTGVLSNCNSSHSRLGIWLGEEERTMFDVLAEAGYSVGTIGKWHLDGPLEPYVEEPLAHDGNVWDAFTPAGPRRHGHDFWYAYGVFNDHYRPHYWTGDADPPKRVEVREWSPVHEADVAIRYLENEGEAYRQSGRPFCLTVAMNPPHPPHRPVPEEYLEPYRDVPVDVLLERGNVDLESEAPKARAAVRNAAAYFAAVTGVDDQIGRILARLRELGLEDDTLVVFASDHGEMLGSHQLVQKGVLYEEAVRIPLVFSWPGRIPAGTSPRSFGLPDLLPTVLGLLGRGADLPAGVEGHDLSACVLGDEAGEEDGALLFRPAASVRSLLRFAGAERLEAYGPVPPLFPYSPDLWRELEREPHQPELLARLMAEHPVGARGLRTPSHAFVVERDHDGGVTRRLWDLERDPYQLEDRSAAEPALCAELENVLERRARELGDPWYRS